MEGSYETLASHMRFHTEDSPAPKNSHSQGEEKLEVIGETYMELSIQTQDEMSNVLSKGVKKIVMN